ncbi:hypothetical protein C7M84_012051 [Penaeus vannamei]|uniref:Uncharacterized protein n=1 Tax=Penaeus vannamei TaxID=6689 RepID=A0A3R7PKR4_PENVA|nr:hypothetical protein C7M84_012051 [Penaeus vannamei]
MRSTGGKAAQLPPATRSPPVPRTQAPLPATQSQVKPRPSAPASDKVSTGPRTQAPLPATQSQVKPRKRQTGHSLNHRFSSRQRQGLHRSPDASATTGHSITGKAATPSAPASDKVSTGPPDASATTGHSITGKAATPQLPPATRSPPVPRTQAPLPATQSQVKPRPPQLPPATRSPPVPRTQAPLPATQSQVKPRPLSSRQRQGLHRSPDASATTGHSITGKAATPSAPASDKATGPLPATQSQVKPRQLKDASATTGHSITGKAAQLPPATRSPPSLPATHPRPPQLPPATRSPPVPRTQAPLPLLHRAPHSRRSHPHQVTGTSPHQRPPQDALPSVITRMFGTVGVPPMVASFKPEADSLSALPRISETSGLSRLVVSLTPEDELPSAAPHVSETIGVSHLVVSLKPEDGLPSVPSRVTVICYDSAVDIRVKPEDGLPSEILRASEASDASIRTFFFSGPRLTAPTPPPSLRGLFGAGERAIYGWHGIDDFRLSERLASVALPAPRGKGWSLFTLDQRQRDPCPPRACQGVPYCKVTHPQVAVLDLPTPTRATSVTHALGLPTPAAPVASHTLSIVLPSTSRNDARTDLTVGSALTPPRACQLSFRFCILSPLTASFAHTVDYTLVDPLTSPSLLKGLAFLP